MKWPWTKEEKIDIVPILNDLKFQIKNNLFIDMVGNYYNEIIDDIYVHNIEYNAGLLDIEYFIYYRYGNNRCTTNIFVTHKELDELQIIQVEQYALTYFYNSAKLKKLKHNSPNIDMIKQSDFITMLNNNIDQVLMNVNTIQDIRASINALDVDNIEEKSRVDMILQKQLEVSVELAEEQHNIAQKVDSLDIYQSNKSELIDLEDYDNCCIKATQKFKDGNGRKYCNDCGKQITLKMVEMIK